jgi:hypothetical protein
MSSLKEMKGIKPKVKWLLENFTHLRSDDNKLIANVWHNEINHDMSASQFLRFFADGKLTSPESIRRMRQKLQEQIPRLRGNKYKNRMFLEKEMRSNIIKL